MAYFSEHFATFCKFVFCNFVIISLVGILQIYCEQFQKKTTLLPCGVNSAIGERSQVYVKTFATETYAQTKKLVRSRFRTDEGLHQKLEDDEAEHGFLPLRKKHTLGQVGEDQDEDNSD